MAKTAAETLREIGAALASGRASLIAALFADDCIGDILAFTWDLRTTSGPRSIAQRMGASAVGTLSTLVVRS
jgi:hypothetical protein